jgi:hypothetical protein
VLIEAEEYTEAETPSVYQEYITWDLSASRIDVGEVRHLYVNASYQTPEQVAMQYTPGSFSTLVSALNGRFPVLGASFAAIGALPTARSMQFPPTSSATDTLSVSFPQFKVVVPYSLWSKCRPLSFSQRLALKDRLLRSAR